MPTDQRRITGPESTIPYRLYSVNNVKTFEQLYSEVIDSNKTRRDKRTLTSIRKMEVEIGCVARSKGSAYIQMGKTKVVAAVYEPRETPKQSTFDGMGDLYVEVKYAPFSTIKRSQLQPSSEEREMAATVKRALEPAVLRHLFPNFQIDIYIYILENDGACLSTIINAAGLALADAEVPLYDMVIALTVGIQGKLTFIDPTSIEEQLCFTNNINSTSDKDHGIIVKTILPELNQITELWQNGAISVDKIIHAIDSYQPMYTEILHHLQAVLANKCKKFLQKKQHSEKNDGLCDIDVGKLIDNVKNNVQIK